MKIESIELRRIFLPYVAPFETSAWREEGSYPIIVRVEANGIVGWGEAPVGENPFYNEENWKTAWAIATCTSTASGRAMRTWASTSPRPRPSQHCPSSRSTPFAGWICRS